MKTIVSVILVALCIAHTMSFVALATEIPEKAIVKIFAESEGKRRVGSGFVVKLESQGAYIVTASHVVVGDKYPNVEFSTQKDIPVSATVVELEGGDDKGLALLLVPKQELPPQLSTLRLATSTPASHETLKVVGFPRSVRYLSIITAHITRRGRDIVFMEQLAEGFSGSPMLQEGLVAGIVVETAGDYGLVVPVDIIRLFVENSIGTLPLLKIKFLKKWGSEGEGNGQFLNPWGIGTGTGAPAYVYVSDGRQSRVQVFSPNGRFLHRLPEKIFGNFLAVNGNGSVYVINREPVPNPTYNYRVEVYYYDQFVKSFKVKDANYRGIAADMYGENIYMTDINEQRVLRFNADGQILAQWGSTGSGNGQFHHSSPWGIDVDNFNRKVFVTDGGNHRIQVFSPDGSFLTKWGTHGTGDGQFNWPVAVTVDYNLEHVYVIDQKNTRIQVFSPNGEFLGKWGSAGCGDGEFRDPYGIDIDHNENIYVIDPGCQQVQVFRVVWE